MANRTKLSQTLITISKLSWMLCVATTVMYLTREHSNTGHKREK